MRSKHYGVAMYVCKKGFFFRIVANKTTKNNNKKAQNLIISVFLHQSTFIMCSICYTSMYILYFI